MAIMYNTDILSFKKLIDKWAGYTVLDIKRDWDTICSTFCIDTSMMPLQEYKGASVAIEPKKHQISCTIRRLMSGAEFHKFQETQEIIDQLYYEQVINGIDNSHYICLAHHLQDSLHYFDEYHGFRKLEESPEWDIIVKLLLIIKNASGSCYLEHPVSREKVCHAKAIKYLVDSGYNVQYEDDVLRPQLPDNTIIKRILLLIEQIGKRTVINWCLKQINQRYLAELDRYLIGRNISQVGNSVPSFPFVYLLNLAMKNFSPETNIVTSTQLSETTQELENLVRNYIICYGLEPLSLWPLVFTDNILEYVSKMALFDTCYIPKQLSHKHAQILCNRLFEWVEKEDKNLFNKLQTHMYLFCYITELFQQNNPAFYIEDKTELLNHIFGSSTISNLSINAQKINASYTDPNQGFILADSIYKNPLISCDDGTTLIMPQPIFSFAFFEKIYDLIKQNFSTRPISFVSDKVGNSLECFVQSILERTISNTAITIHKNKKFTIPGPIRQKYSLQRRDLECDLILETSDTIILLEIKSALMTEEAMMGHHYDLLKTIQMVILKPIEQALSTYLLLSGEKSIDFDNGGVLNLNSRKVIPISLTLFDYGALHTNILINKILTQILEGVQYKTDSKEPATIKRINDINILMTKIKDLMINIESTCGMQSSREITMLSQFISVPLLLQILEDYSYDITKFINFLNKNKFVCCGEQDSFFSYYHNLKRFIN